MIVHYPYEVWSWKYNQFIPCRITEWCGAEVEEKAKWFVEKNEPHAQFVRVHYIVPKLDKEPREVTIIKEEGDQLVDIRSLRMNLQDDVRQKATWEERKALERFDFLSSLSPGTELSVRGFDVIVDEAVPDEEGNIRLFYKYIQCDEETGRKVQEMFPAWSWINSYGCQFKKVQAGYNFITLKPEDNIVFRPWVPSRLEEHRASWYFEDPLDKGVIADLERVLGYVRDDGKTWMEYFLENVSGYNVSPRLRPTGELICVDASNPKNPIQLPDPKNPEQILMETNPEVFIEKVVEYVKSKTHE